MNTEHTVDSILALRDLGRRRLFIEEMAASGRPVRVTVRESPRGTSIAVTPLYPAPQRYPHERPKQNRVYSTYVRKLDVSAPEWEKLRLIVFERDGHRCRYCAAGADKAGTLHCDHVQPLAKGGRSTLENLAAACRSCNLAKKDKTLLEWKGPK